MEMELTRLKRFDIENYKYYEFKGYFIRIDIRTNTYQVIKGIRSTWESIEYNQIQYLGAR